MHVKETDVSLVNNNHSGKSQKHKQKEKKIYYKTFDGVNFKIFCFHTYIRDATFNTVRMDELLHLLNRIQEIFTILGIKCGSKAFPDLPQIVITGAQSSGKSSILESLVGRSFLPRGPGIVTRRPLLVQLIYCSKKELARVGAELSSPNLEAWGCFSHKLDRRFIRFDEIRQEILTETIRLAGENHDINAEPIYLKIYSNSVNLTFVDLPGLIKMPIGDQPQDIEQRVRDIVLHYISMKNCIILAVIPANTDITMSESLQLAQNVDPHGERTIAVITKLDLMDEGTDASDILNGRFVSIPLGIIGVVNRSQRELQQGKTISLAIADEANFLKLHYPKLVSRNGVPFLAKTLQHLLIDKINLHMPEIKSSVASMTNHYQLILKTCGDPVFDKGQVVINVITDYCSIFTSCIKGNANDLDTSELSEGARISYIFQESYGRTLESINPLTGYNKAKILTAMRNASGTCPGIFIPESSFELLVKQQIKLLEEPSLQCANLVYQELERVIANSARKCAKDLQRFYNLHRRILDISSDIIRLRLPDAYNIISQLIAIQMAYINTNHPDFLKDSILLNPCIKSGKNDFELKDIPSCLNSYCENNIAKSEEYILKDVHLVHTQESEVIIPTANEPPVLKTIDSRRNTVQIFDNRETSDCIIIEELIKCYFNIVRKNVQDYVPKAIMHCLVNYVLDHLQQQLVTQLYQPEQFDELLMESRHIIDKRKETSDIIKVLDKATEVINEIRDYHTLSPVSRLW